MEDDRLISIKEAAELLGESRRSTRRRVNRQELSAHVLPASNRLKLRLAEVRAFMDASRLEARG